ncbi:MAG: zinc ribbon domain-containing protein, partial [Bacteroidota bacterium]
MYEQARKRIYARTRHVINPRILTSVHLLSGFMRCKKCGAAMTPLGAKSGKFHYY